MILLTSLHLASQDTVKAVREAVGPHFPIAVKLNSADFQQGGFSPEEAVAVSTMLEEQGGIDLLEISGGNYESGIYEEAVGEEKGDKDKAENKRASTVKREAYFLQYAIEIKKALKSTPVMVTGGWRAKQFMEQAIRYPSIHLIYIILNKCSITDCYSY